MRGGQVQVLNLRMGGNHPIAYRQSAFAHRCPRSYQRHSSSWRNSKDTSKISLKFTFPLSMRLRHKLGNWLRGGHLQHVSRGGGWTVVRTSRAVVLARTRGQFPGRPRSPRAPQDLGGGMVPWGGGTALCLVHTLGIFYKIV